MGITISRRARLTALGAGLATAAALALSASTPALADATDGAGTATITFSTNFLTHLAKAGIIAIPDGPATSSGTTGHDSYTFPVTGGNGTDTNFSGIVDLGGALTFIDAATGHTVQLTNLAFNYYSGDVTAVPAGTTTTINLAFISGNQSTDNVTGTPPAPSTETFNASQLDLDNWGASYLNNHLKAIVKAKNGKKHAPFTAGTSTDNNGAFTITYAVTIS